MVFIIFFFLHCDFRMSSWDYFIATAVIYTACWLYAQCRTWFEHGVRHKASLVAESEYTLKITIDSRMEWAPGQHIFLRFLTCGVHALTAHPFTICSVPQRNGENKLVFYVKKRGGVTARLMALAKKTPGFQVPVMMDGPYGGFSEGRLDEFDKTLVIGGGAGTGLALSLIEDFVRFSPYRQAKEMKVILATRDPGMKAWYLQALENLAVRQSWQKPVPGLSIHLHETYSTTPTISARTDNKQFEVDEGAGTQSIHSKESESSVHEIFSIQLFTGRPDLPTATHSMAEHEGCSVGLVVCGPASMTHDVSAAASEAQSHILANKPGFARELWLHRENFS